MPPVDGMDLENLPKEIDTEEQAESGIAAIAPAILAGAFLAMSQQHSIALWSSVFLAIIIPAIQDQSLNAHSTRIV